jgi:H+/Cl- antiporter ClcA
MAHAKNVNRTRGKLRRSMTFMQARRREPWVAIAVLLLLFILLLAMWGQLPHHRPRTGAPQTYGAVNTMELTGEASCLPYA